MVARSGEQTELRLVTWRQGKTQAERLCGGLLLLEDYESVDPQAPLGGPDGTKDVLCRKNGILFVGACFFPPTEQRFAEIEKKFAADMLGATKNAAQGIVFVVNQRLTVAQRDKLVKKASALGLQADIIHVERIRLLLDSPRGYGLRLEFLRISMTKEEQIAFWDQFKGSFEDTLRAQSKEFSALKSRIDTYVSERLKSLDMLPYSVVFFGEIVRILRRIQDERVSETPYFEQFVSAVGSSLDLFRKDFDQYLATAHSQEEVELKRRSFAQLLELVDSARKIYCDSEKTPHWIETLFASALKAFDPASPDAGELIKQYLEKGLREGMVSQNSTNVKLQALASLMQYCGDLIVKGDLERLVLDVKGAHDLSSPPGSPADALKGS